MIEIKEMPETYTEFLENYRGNFEKRKYFNISMDGKITEREPSWLLELAYIYYLNDKNQSGIEKKKIKEVIKKNFSECFKEKYKKIDRMSKFTIGEIKEKFWKTLVNRESVHALKFGNELFIRDKNEFFSVLYTYAMLMSDVNKLIKVYFLELIWGAAKSEYEDELLKNTINYLCKSDSEPVKTDFPEYMEYFDKYKADKLYNLIYERVFQRSGNTDKNMLKMKAEAVMSTEKEILYNYLKKKA